ncbi:SRPBCC domain-containing protein [Variovorax sp. KK3]|uniref:SRPBCC domain-containing protein n=1 Tax=Variovorax sp. KK3 TaxID=1855728 RepID=UPI00097CBB2A|nr:SRPBCC domain-containing protein [Variovorax sp. KK3]
MEFRNDFIVDGAPADVIAVFENVPLVAGFLPGASVGEQREDGSYPGQLVVSFGPKRLTFKGSLLNTVRPQDLAGELTGQASADVRGAKMAVSLRYQLIAEGAGRTRVETVSEAELAGMLAEFARTGGTVLTQALLDQFAQRFSEHMRATVAVPGAVGTVPGSSDAAAAPAGGAATSAAAGATKPLSAFGLLWQMIRSMFGRGRAHGAPER